LGGGGCSMHGSDKKCRQALIRKPERKDMAFMG